MTSVTVRAEHEYDVVIGRALLGELPRLLFQFLKHSYMVMYTRTAPV